MYLCKLLWGQVTQATVRSALIVFLFPSIGNLLSLAYISKQLHVQALITELAYEALDVCVLPWASRFNVNGFASFFLQPLPYSLSHKFWTVIAANVLGHPAHQE